MNKINPNPIQKLQNCLSTIKKTGGKIEYPHDSFQKEVSPKKNLGIEHATNVLSRADFEKLSNRLIERDYWTDTLNFVGFNKIDNSIQDVNIGVFNPIKASLDRHKMSIPEFIELYTNIAAININKTPVKEKEYKTNYLNLIKYLNENKSDL